MSISMEDRLVSELTLFQAITEGILSETELDSTLRLILSGITHPEKLGFNRAFLFLADENGRELHAHSAEGMSDPLARQLIGFTVPVTASAPPIADGDEGIPIQALVAHVAALKHPFHSNSIQAVYHPPTGSGGEVLQFTRVAAIPLLRLDKILGVLLVDNTDCGRDIGEREIRALVTMGNLAVIAIEHNQIHRMLDNMASLDGLTGVFNRRYFETRLGKEVRLAVQAGRALTLLVFHLDGFRECDQNHGYERGNQVLKDLASFLKKKVRTEDLIVRYGEEDFLVMLTGGANKEEASRVAEKLVSQFATLGVAGLPPGELTVSCGIAWMPPEALDQNALANLVERALHEAKRIGTGCAILDGSR